MAPGPKPEPDVSNERFLHSYLDVACWLRVVSARQYVSIACSQKSTRIEKLAAIASFYQTTGLVQEDALSMYTALSFWSLDKSKLLPDILERISVRSGDPSRKVSPTYATDLNDKYFQNTKRLDIYARPYLTQVMSFSDDELPAIFGVNWKKHPSVKIVAKNQRAFWDKMGEHIRQLVEPSLNPKSEFIAACHNKIKHGPQVIMGTVSDAASERGLSFPSLDGSVSFETIRILLKGARTQETQDEIESDVRVAPFLVTDENNLERLFSALVMASVAIYTLGTWVLNTNFPDMQRQFKVSPELQKMIDRSLNNSRLKLNFSQ